MRDQSRGVRVLCYGTVTSGEPLQAGQEGGLYRKLRLVMFFQRAKEGAEFTSLWLASGALG